MILDKLGDTSTPAKRRACYEMVDSDQSSCIDFEEFLCVLLRTGCMFKQLLMLCSVMQVVRRVLTRGAAESEREGGFGLAYLRATQTIGKVYRLSVASQIKAGLV